MKLRVGRVYVAKRTCIMQPHGFKCFVRSQWECAPRGHRSAAHGVDVLQGAAWMERLGVPRSLRGHPVRVRRHSDAISLVFKAIGRQQSGHVVLVADAYVAVVSAGLPARHLHTHPRLAAVAARSSRNTHKGKTKQQRPLCNSGANVCARRQKSV